MWLIAEARPHCVTIKMDFSLLYQQKLYRRIIICWSCCETDEEYLILCLSLYAIGRQKAAVALLHSRMHLVANVMTKVTYLKHLAAINGTDGYSDELLYWEKVLGASIGATHVSLPESTVVGLGSQIAKFKEAGAKIQPGSYAECCLQEKRYVQEIQSSRDYGPIIFQVAAGGGPFDDFWVMTKPIEGWADKLQKEWRRVELPFKGDFFQHVEFIRNVVHLAAYYYMSGNAAMSLTLCDVALDCISDLQNYKKVEIDLDGILEYEIQTVAFMAIDFVDTKTVDDKLSCYLEAILKKPFSINGRSLTGTVFKNDYVKSPLRESRIFSSCGHVFRVRATKQATPVTLIVDGEKQVGVILNRSNCIEAARNYIIAAATDASDDPEIIRKYDQAIWCLILGGGIDLVVLQFFFKLRGFHERNLFFAYGEPKRSIHQKPSMAWPEFTNQYEVLEIISRLYLEFGSEINCKRLAPTIVDRHEKLYVAATFLPTQHDFFLQGDRLKATKTGQIKFSSKALNDCVQESRQMAELWYDCYLEIHKEMPIEFERFFQDKILANSPLCN